MITKIEIQNAASYKTRVEIKPKPVNFLYGSNGSGKTTISRLLFNPNKYTYSSVTQDEERKTLVYNNDFVDLHFNNNSLIKGIFTLGKDSNEALEKIKELEETNNNLKDEIKNKEKSIEKSNLELNSKKTIINDQCWKFKNEYNFAFKELFKGNVGTKDSFANYCLNINSTDSERKTFEELKKIYNSLYVNKLTFFDKIEYKIIIDISDLKGLKSLNESIISNKSLQMSILIEKLMNSDWVKKGVDYLLITKDLCPFCQQKINFDKLSMINKLFDESYEKTINLIKEAKKQYSFRVSDAIIKIENVLNTYKNIFDLEELDKNLFELKNILSQNKSIFEKKLANPSQKFSLIPFEEKISNINNIIEQLNSSIDENNRKAKNVENEKDILKENVNNSLYDKLKEYINSYKKDVKGLNIGITNIKGKIDNLKKERDKNILEIDKLRSSMSGISNTLEKMNKILESFGFTGFRFAANDSSTYKVIRADGSSVGKTLSEGEQRFISFLYFYQLIQGTLTENGRKEDCIVVIDDPISSLDSNILFIVSTLVKNIIDDCLTSQNNIEQVFILTHNVYFFKEITFRSNRGKISFNKKNTAYFIINKNNESSYVKEYDNNPISTTYDLLWDEIRDDSKKNKGTIFNTMRRILEYYFNIIGGLKYEEIINKFEGEEKQICHSLLSCINDYSHYIPDDYSIIVTNELIEKYIKVFKLVFEKSGHISHYEMMMKK